MTPSPSVYQGFREWAWVLTGWMWRKRFENVVCERARSEEGSGFRKRERHAFRGRARSVARKPASALTPP
jgi:hypothetical protein